MEVMHMSINTTVVPLFLRSQGSISREENANSNLVIAHTDYTLNPKKDSLVNWIAHLLDLSTRTDELKEFILKQESQRYTCTQFSVSSAPDTDDENCHEIDGFGMHRHNGERTVLPFYVNSNNRRQFEEWSTSHVEALRLNLTNPDNIHLFREHLGLEPAQRGPQVESQSDPYYIDLFTKMYSDLIVDFQEKYQWGFSPMNDGCMMIACYYAMLCASPDIFSKQGVEVGSLDPNDFLCSSAFEGMVVGEEDILHGYLSMITSAESPINKIVNLQVHSLHTSKSTDARDAVSSLHELSSIVALKSSPSRVSLIERLESLFIAIDSLPHDGVNVDNCSQSFTNTHWCVPGKAHDIAETSIFTSQAFQQHLNKADIASLKDLSRWIESRYHVSLPCKPTVDNLIKNEVMLQLYPIGRNMDFREMNNVCLGPLIWRLMNQAWKDKDLADDGDHSSSIPQVVQCLKDSCGTYWHYFPVTRNSDSTSRATVAVLMMYDAARSLDKQPLLLKCFTRANDSDSPDMSLKDEVQLLGKLLVFASCLKYAWSILTYCVLITTFSVDDIDRISIVVDCLAQSIVDVERVNLERGKRCRASKRMHFTFLRMHLYASVMRAVVTGTLYPRQKTDQGNCSYTQLVYILNHLDDTRGESTDAKLAEQFFLAAGTILDSNVQPHFKQRATPNKKLLTSLLLSFSELGSGDKFVVILIFYAANIIRNIKREDNPIAVHNEQLVETPSCGNGSTHRTGYMFSDAGKDPVDIESLDQFSLNHGILSLESIVASACECETFATRDYHNNEEAELDFYKIGELQNLSDSDDDNAFLIQGPGTNASGNKLRSHRRKRKVTAGTDSGRKRKVIQDETESDTEVKETNVLVSGCARLLQQQQSQPESGTAKTHSLNNYMDVDSLGVRQGLPELNSPGCDDMIEFGGGQDGSILADKRQWDDQGSCQTLLSTTPDEDTLDLMEFSFSKNHPLELYTLNLGKPLVGDDMEVYKSFLSENVKYKGDKDDNEDKDDDTKEVTTDTNDNIYKDDKDNNEDKEDDTTEVTTDTNDDTYKDDKDDNEDKDDGTNEVLTDTNDDTNEVMTLNSSTKYSLPTHTFGTHEIARGTPSNDKPPYDVIFFTRADMLDAIHGAKSLCNMNSENVGSSCLRQVIDDRISISELTVENESLKYLCNELMLPLTDEEKDKVNSVITPTWSEDDDSESAKAARNGVLYTCNNISLSSESMSGLRPNIWLSDLLIDFYLEIILASRDSKLGKKTVYYSSYFAQTMFNDKNKDEKLRGKYSYRGVKNWSKRCNIFDMDYILCPCNHENMHWSVGVISMKEKRIYWYDSKGRDHKSRALGLMQYVRDEYKATYKVDMDDSVWRVMPCSPESPQTNGDDCGVWVCMYCHFVSLGYKPVFIEKHINHFRQRIALSIIRHCQPSNHG